MKKTGIKELLEAILIMLTAFFIIAMSVFVLDANGTFSKNRISQLAMDENSQETGTYYKVNDEFMFSIDDGFIAIMRYEKSSWPLRFACGTFAPQGDSVNYPFQQGDWFYALNGDDYRLLNISDGSYQEHVPFEEIEALGLTFYEEEQVTEEEITSTYEPLSVQKESCITISAAFLLLYIVLLPAYLVVWIRSRRKKA